MGNGFTGSDPTGGPPGGFNTGSVVGGLASVGAGMYDSYQNRKTSRENTDKTLAAQKAEAELAYQRSVEMWNMQNLYNSPEAQMNRFKEAGLNPHLIYGQGSAGNASSPPQYQPANLQYKYEAPAYGAAVNSVVPTLMAVGTWMQNMRLSEAELESKKTNTEKSRQLIDFLVQKNPMAINEIENRLSLFPYQQQMQQAGVKTAQTKLADMNADYRYKYGDDLWSELPFSSTTPSQGKIGGIRKLQFMQQESKTALEGARASWADFDITNPQAIIQLVLSGVMGLAGQTMRLSTGKINPKRRITHETSETMRGGRIKTRRRIID